MDGWRVVVDDLVFPECPRWHDGELWFSDMHDHRVLRVDAAGTVHTEARVNDDVPAGLGWLADGRLLIVGQERRQLLRREADGTIVVHADLDALMTGSANDMIVRADGVAFVGDMGSRIHGTTGERQPGRVIRVDPDGSASVAAEPLASPNGMILTGDEATLIVAESGAMCLTIFDVAADGSLSGQRPFAALAPEDPAVRFSPPDGICLDAAGAVWFADPIGKRVVRVMPGGQVTDSHAIGPGLGAFACVLGGADRRTLFACVAAGWTGTAVTEQRSGRIVAREVAVPGAGAP